MGEDVHRSVGADGLRDGEQIVGHLAEPVGGVADRMIAFAEPAAVVGDDVELLGQRRRHMCPEVMAVGPAVDEQDGRALGTGLAELENSQVDPAVGDTSSTPVDHELSPSSDRRG